MYAVCKTDIGQVRSSNQDICRCGTFSDGSAWTVVCDGMGGVNGGNIASSVACDAICKAITENYGYGRRRSARHNAACNQ